MEIEGSVGRASRNQTMSRGRALAGLADRQHGVVSFAQLATVGLDKHAVSRLAARGSLLRIHRGVYAVGHHPKTQQGWWLAAVLATGPGAALAFRSAAALWAMRSSSRPRIEVIAPRLCRRPGIEAHCIALPDDEMTLEDGIPVTTPARTLFDLAAVVSLHHLEAAFNEAEYRRLSSPTSLDALLTRYPRRRGTQAIRRVLDNHRRNGETRTRSELERALLALLDAHGLPRPKINRNTDQGELDARWPEQRLVVECDGFATHGTRKAFEDDRARDRALTTAGWRVVRITWRQLSTHGDTIAAQLEDLLAQPETSSRPAHSSTARSWAA